MTRVESKVRHHDNQEFQVLSLKEFNEVLGANYRVTKERSSVIEVKKSRIKKHLLIDPTRVIIHLLSQKAVRFPSDYEGYLIPLNFVALDFDETADPDYITWYFNEHPKMKKQLILATQGSSVTSLSLVNLKDLKVELPDIKKQKQIGKAYRLSKDKQKLQQERISLEQEAIKQKLINVLEGTT
ncbi:restriction endonuclease subunit S domain-containing protein [Evansella halocellulosilytica]|uniref:hypothetical protein n=1 Tax=Evansella halocellulosilytica TaxID=2011013 RepID=UPI000BB969E7|nr:hypothetical protein [Evansella halocellulosilytica]